MLRDYFSQFGELSEENMQILLGSCQRGNLTKGEELVKTNSRVDSIYFVEEGFLHYYTDTENGDRCTLKVVSPNYFWTMLDEFFNQKQTVDACVALTDVTFCEIKRDDYNALKESNKTIAQFIHSVTEQILSFKVIEANNKSKMTIEERYIDLLENNPQMIQEVPVSILASYIGTSRETLHRIRKKLAAA